MIQLIAFALCLAGKCSATSVKVIGPMIDAAIPVRAYITRRIVKLGASIQPIMDPVRRMSPPRSIDFGLKRILRTLNRRAEMTPTIDAAVLICPVTQTSCLNVKPMSIRSRLVSIPGGIVAKREITREGRSICPFPLVSSLEPFI